MPDTASWSRLCAQVSRYQLPRFISLSRCLPCPVLCPGPEFCLDCWWPSCLDHRALLLPEVQDASASPEHLLLRSWAGLLRAENYMHGPQGQVCWRFWALSLRDVITVSGNWEGCPPPPLPPHHEPLLLQTRIVFLPALWLPVKHLPLG